MPSCYSKDMVGGRKRGGGRGRKGRMKEGRMEGLCAHKEQLAMVSPKRFETVLLLKLGRAKSSISHTR